jgi:cell division protein FtsB
MAAGERGLPAVWKARRQAQTVARDIAALKAENATLRARAQALRADARTIELEARETLGLARAGEIVVLRRR